MPYIYKHGVYSELLQSDVVSSGSVDTVPVIVSAANSVRASAPAQILTPKIVTSLSQAKEEFGYSDDMSYGMNHAFAAAFRLGPVVAPLICINVFDDDKHYSDGSQTVAIPNDLKVALAHPDVIPETVSIAGAVAGTDFNIAVSESGIMTLTFSGENDYSAGEEVTITYRYADPSKVTDEDVIDGLEAIETIYQSLNVIPTLILAPGYSHIPAVYRKMCEIADAGIGEKWQPFVLADLDSTETGAQSNADAIDWKDENGYDHSKSKVYWPAGKAPASITADPICLSAVAMAVIMRTDAANGGVPSVSDSNKLSGLVGLVCQDGTPVSTLSESKANALNAVGISTALYSGGTWRMWGPHVASYKAGTEQPPEQKSDVAQRMTGYTRNSLTIRYLDAVDGPLSRRVIETIMVDVQMWLNSLIAADKLLPGSAITFEQSANPDSAIVEGDFVFDLKYTTVPTAKSITFRMRLTQDGLASLTEGGNE